MGLQREQAIELLGKLQGSEDKGAESKNGKREIGMFWYGNEESGRKGQKLR